MTLDSTNVTQILRELIAKIPAEKCVIGVGTVTDAAQVRFCFFVCLYVCLFIYLLFLSSFLLHSSLSLSLKVEEVARLGVKFAISPINPTNFVSTCHQHGVLAMPAAFTPNELWETHKQGARAVKLFPAQLWNPEALKVWNERISVFF